MAIPRASAAVERGRQRRAAAATEKNARFQWFTREVSDRISLSMRERVRVATEMLLSKVVTNISRPVTKGRGPRGGRVVLDRSKSGEFPKAETVTLLKGIFTDVREDTPGIIDGFCGTPHDYGAILETKMNRSFLVRTLREEQDSITQILTGPIG